MEESPNERGKRIIQILAEAGRQAGLAVQEEYPVIGGRIDVAWLWQGPKSFPSALPLVGFEVESSWRTRKHLKGDFLNLLDLQPALGVIVLLGEGQDVESTRRFAKHMVDRRGARIEVWSESDVLALAGDAGEQAARLLSDVATPESPLPGMEVGHSSLRELTHSGKYTRLGAWLASHADDRVRLRFDEIEEILGFPLPPSSRKHAAHWHSYEGSAVVRAIHDVGWKVGRLDLPGEVVIFERKSARRSP
jgi:hypothetical protein